VEANCRQARVRRSAVSIDTSVSRRPENQARLEVISHLASRVVRWPRAEGIARFSRPAAGVVYDRRAMSTRDLPQASSLAKVRELVAAIDAGHDTVRAAGDAVGVSKRHADYYALAATTTLRLAERDGARLRVTTLGKTLLATSPRSQEEREIWRRAIEGSESIASIAHDLLDHPGPTREALTHRMIHAGLSPATAARRASTLLAWRRYALDPQASLEL
jgi:hypothetical protein